MEAAQSDFKKKLGENILKLRTYLKQSQEELAHKIGKQFINRDERKGANTSAFILAQITQVLKVTLTELTGPLTFIIDNINMYLVGQIRYADSNPTDWADSFF